MKQPVIKSSLEVQIAELEEKISHKKAVIHLAEQEIKSDTERRNEVRRLPMKYVAKKHHLDRYDAKIREKKFRIACAETDILRYQAKLEKLKAHLPKA